MSRALFREEFNLKSGISTGTEGRIQALLELIAEGMSKLMVIEDLTSRMEVIRGAKRQAIPEVKFVSIPFSDIIEKLTGPGKIQAETADLISRAYGAFQQQLRLLARQEVLGIVQQQIGSLVASGGTTADFVKWSERLTEGHVSDAWAETTFRTVRNMAHAAGRTQQAFEVAGVVAFRYAAVGGRSGDGDTRDNHRANHGLMWAKRHPVWTSRMPPNGYRCRCRVLMITLSEARRLGRIDDQGRFISDDVPEDGEPDPGFSESPVFQVYGGF